MSLQFSKSAESNVSRLAVKGEVDVSNASELTSALNELLDAKPECIEIDMAQVPYIDSTGIGVLVAASKQASENNIKFSISSPQPNVMRVLSMLGVVSEFNLDEQ